MLRLDGSTSITKRQKLVKIFCDPTDNQFVFLLSSKVRILAPKFRQARACAPAALESFERCPARCVPRQLRKRGIDFCFGACFESCFGAQRRRVLGALLHAVSPAGWAVLCDLDLCDRARRVRHEVRTLAHACSMKGSKGSLHHDTAAGGQVRPEPHRLNERELIAF